MADQTDVRHFGVRAVSCDTFGRVLCNSRNHHFVVDGPAQNGCPGEALNPPELFLAGVASCGVELIQVLARDADFPLLAARVTIDGELDRSRPVRPDLTVFNAVRLDFHLVGVDEQQADQLVKSFKGR